MSLTGDNTAKFWASCPKVLGHRRRSSSSGLFNYNITEPLLAKYKHLAKLHSDSSALGLNAVNKPSLPRGTLFRSSLPATPLTSPMYPSILHQFTEKAIQELLGKSSTPKVVKSSSDFELKLSNTLQTPTQKTRTNLFDIPPMNDQNIVTRGSLISRPKTLDIKNKVAVTQLTKINENKLDEEITNNTTTPITEQVNNQSSTSLYYSIKEEQEEIENDCTVEEPIKLAADDKLNDKSNAQASNKSTNLESISQDVTITNNVNKNSTIETIVLDDSSILDDNAVVQKLADVKIDGDQADVASRTVQQNGVKHDEKTDRTNEEPQTNCLFVSNLHNNLNNEELKEYFTRFGKVVQARIIYDHHKKISKCYGFVTFSNQHDVQKILSMPKDNFKQLKGRTVHMSLAKNKKK